VVVASLLAVASPARADSITIIFNTGLPTVSGSTFTYHDVTLTFNNNLQKGDFFTIVDFQGLTSVSLVAASNPNSVAQDQNQGWVFNPGDWLVTAPATVAGAPNDSIALPDILITYIGAGVNSNNGRINLGDIVATTSMSVFTLATESTRWQDHTSNNAVDQGQDDTQVPFSANGPVLPLPSVAMSGMGLFGLLGFGRFRRRAEAASV